MSIFAGFISLVGSLLANASSTACLGWVFDETECPKELIK